VHHENHSEATLPEAERAQGLSLFCSAHPRSDLVIQARIADALADIVSRRLPGRIEHLEWPAADVAVLRVKLPASDPFIFRPGQYVDIILGNGQRRSYSIASGALLDGALEFHIRHMPGGEFTDMLFAQASPLVRERGILRLEGPLGSFYLREASDAPILLLASGTGFAPIKAIVEQIIAAGLHRDDPATGRRARPVHLYWGARAQPDLYMDALPRQWASEQPNFTYVPVLSEALTGSAAAEKGIAPWTGRTGFVHHAVMQDLPDLSAFEVYACGVPVMVKAAHQDFVARCGLPESQFFSDAFVSKADLAAK
jgi:CDP-4-dehydro-6-deoxyglucose reductase